MNQLNILIPDIELIQIREATEKLILGFGISDEKANYVKNLRRLSSDIKEKIPKELICPITSQLFYEPVMTNDGLTYEGKAIHCWLAEHDTSPLTGQKLTSKDLIPNVVIEKLVRNFHDQNLDLLK